MYENYFMTLANFEELEVASRRNQDAYYNLSSDQYRSWCKDDPELDNLRKGARRL